MGHPNHKAARAREGVWGEGHVLGPGTARLHLSMWRGKPGCESADFLNTTNASLSSRRSRERVRGHQVPLSLSHFVGPRLILLNLDS
jgi:hypothetical protein